MSCGSEWEAENAYIAKDLSLEIARKSIELGRRIGKMESEIATKLQPNCNNLQQGQQDDIFPMEIVAGKCPIESGGNCPLKSKGEWIPVSERLPEEKINQYTNDFDEVLCTTDWGEVQAFKFGTPILHHKPHFWLGGAIMDEHIIAWQYKPEPYKEEGAE